VSSTEANGKPPWILNDDMCPQWRKSRKKMCHKCAFYQWIKYEDAQTGREVTQWDCVIIHQNGLAVNQARESSRNVASIDKMATVMAVYLQVIADASAKAQGLPPPKDIMEEANAIIDYSGREQGQH